MARAAATIATKAINLVNISSGTPGVIVLVTIVLYEMLVGMVVADESTVETEVHSVVLVVRVVQVTKLVE